MNLKDKSFEEIVLYLSFAFFLFFIPISIAISQFFLFLSFLVWIYLLIRNKTKFEFPSVFIPLIAYSFFTILSTIFSVDFITSLKDLKELLLFLIVPVLFNSFKNEKPLISFNYALSFSIILSFLVSFAQFKGITFPQERVSGFLGHYMTQSGIILLFLCLSLSMIFIEKKLIKIFWIGIFILSLILLLMTYARSAWIGTFFAISTILILFRPKFLIVVIPLLILIILLSPISVKRRFISILDLKDETNRDRIHMVIAGTKIISKYPLFGSGPDTVRLIYSKYKPEGAIRNNPHLHNNVLQIFAEKGIFAVISWLWFIILALKKNWEIFKRGKEGFFEFSALGAIGAITGLFISGLFEYNFGDSEVKMLFLYIITHPLLIFKKEMKLENYSKGVPNES